MQTPDMLDNAPLPTPFPTSRRPRLLTVGLLGTGVVAGAVLTGLATAGASTSSPTPQALGAAPVAAATPSAPAQEPPEAAEAPGPDGRGPRGQLLHGTAVVKKADGTVQTRADQVGALTARSATSVTVQSSDGYTATYVVDGTTAVRKDGAVTTSDKLDIGATVRVDAVVTGGTSTAARVFQGQPAKGARGFGHRDGFEGFGPGGPGGPGGPDAPGPAPSASSTPSAVATS